MFTVQCVKFGGGVVHPLIGRYVLCCLFASHQSIRLELDLS